MFAVAGGEPTLVLRDADEPLARETAWVRDVRSYRLHADDAAAVIAGVAREKGLGGGRVAVELQSYALPHAFGLALAEAPDGARRPFSFPSRSCAGRRWRGR